MCVCVFVHSRVGYYWGLWVCSWARLASELMFAIVCFYEPTYLHCLWFQAKYPSKVVCWKSRWSRWYALFQNIFQIAVSCFFHLRKTAFFSISNFLSFLMNELSMLMCSSNDMVMWVDLLRGNCLMKCWLATYTLLIIIVEMHFFQS